ncbi:MAG: hypothetical protein ACT4TC_21390 [Myxococcaceae bacterium]
MRTRSVGAFLAVTALCLSQVAFAQKAVILEFEGDPTGKLRNQVEWALRKTRGVPVVPFKKFKEAADRKNLRGSRAVSALSKQFEVSVAMEGTVKGETLAVRLLDGSAKELWKRELPLRSVGFLTGDNLRRLSKVITTAASGGAQSGGDEPAATSGTEEGEGELPPLPPEPAATKTEPEAPPQPAKVESKVDIDLSSPPSVSAEKSSSPTSEDVTARDPTTRDRDSDLDEEMTRGKTARIGPKVFTVALVGSLTLRSYCSRPGVASCREYDNLPQASRPPGNTVEFSPQVPYGGGGVFLELFPLASLDNALEGLGIVGSFNLGFSATTVRVENQGGSSTQGTQVNAVDSAISAALVYRYFFGWGDRRQPNIGYVGVRGGLSLRNFAVDKNATAPLPSSQRTAVLAGLDGSVPLGSRYFRLEASVFLLLGAKPGATEQAAYGPVQKNVGFGFDAGLVGDVIGPLGYSAKARFQTYSDTFGPGGTTWVSSGGVAQETYWIFQFGPTVQF